jgi:hypothetical protein
MSADVDGSVDALANNLGAVASATNGTLIEDEGGIS